jgi:coproporphyrinogen III oxidase-like Fe-S oxidoreductase
MSPTSARRLAAAGVTRLSLGVQSFDDAVLRLLGRAHDARTAAAAAAAAVDAGLSLSVDLMCGIPGQTVTSWQETLDRAVRTGAEHVSVYPLALESGTPLAVACDTGLVGEPDVDAAADMMLLAEDLLTAAGILRYETANYARPGLESRHNNAYWTGRGYLGIGPAAHGMLDAAAAEAIGLIPLSASCISDGDVSNGRSRDAEKVGDSTGERVPGDMRSETIARVRYWEASDPQAWLLGPPKGLETLTKEEAQREDIMLGMRLRDGVSALEAHEAGLDAVFETLEAEGLVERAVSQGAVREGRSAGVAPALPNGGSASSSCSTRWRTTRRGWLLGNEVFGRLWAGG